MTEAVSGETIPAPVAPATPPPASSPPPGATADLAMTPGQEARAQIQLLKQNPEWLKRYFEGDPAAKAQLKDLQTREHEHNYSTGQLLFGGPSAQEQRDHGAARLEELGLSKAIVDHHRSGGTVSAEEFRLAQARWDSRKMDPEWRAKLERGDYETKQEYAALLAIRCSRIAV